MRYQFNAERTSVAATDESGQVTLIPWTDDPASNPDIARNVVFEQLYAQWQGNPDLIGGAPAPVSPPARTYKSDIFDRCLNDAEAQTILDGVAAMGVRLNAFFHAVSEVRHDHPLFGDLRDGFVAAFGETRAGELLAPSA